jgi:hypothetical protein
VVARARRKGRTHVRDRAGADDRAGQAPGNTSATAGGRENETGPTSPRSWSLKLVLGE